MCVCVCVCVCVCGGGGMLATVPSSHWCCSTYLCQPTVQHCRLQGNPSVQYLPVQIKTKNYYGALFQIITDFISLVTSLWEIWKWPKSLAHSKKTSLVPRLGKKGECDIPLFCIPMVFVYCSPNSKVSQ